LASDAALGRGRKIDARFARIGLANNDATSVTGNVDEEIAREVSEKIARQISESATPKTAAIRVPGTFAPPVVSIPLTPAWQIGAEGRMD